MKRVGQSLPTGSFELILVASFLVWFAEDKGVKGAQSTALLVYALLYGVLDMENPISKHTLRLNVCVLIMLQSFTILTLCIFVKVH